MRRWLLALLGVAGACSNYETDPSLGSVANPNAVDGGETTAEAGPSDAGATNSDSGDASAPEVKLDCAEVLNDPLTSIASGWGVNEESGGHIAIVDGVLHATTDTTQTAFAIGTIDRTIVGSYAEVKTAFDVRVAEITPITVPGCVLQLAEEASKSSLQIGVGQLGSYVGTSNFRIAGAIGTTETVTIAPLATNNWSHVELTLRVVGGQAQRSILVDGNLASYPVTDDKHLTFTSVHVTCGATTGILAGGSAEAKATLDMRNLLVTACKLP